MKLQAAFRFLAFGLLLLVIPAGLSTTSAAQIGIGISVRIGPPALPVYEQPECPGAGFLWTPGYWAWDDDEGYYWVPGTWVEAPQPGYLWTPGYWGWNNGLYAWNGGYWGPHVGFYGGINYGYGYGGDGFYGGEWRGGSFYYNTAVMRVNTTVIRNVYVNNTVIVNNNVHVAYNGGQGGINARPTPQQEGFAHERHIEPVAAQQQQVQGARQNRENFARVNNGKPAVAATQRPGEFKGPGVVTAKAAGAPYHAPTMSPKEARANAPAKAGAGARPAENRPAAGRPAENRPNAPASRPFVPPSKNNANRPAENARPSEARPSEARPSPAPRENNPRPNESRPAPQARESAPHQNAPRPAPQAHEAAPRPAPQREAAPQKEAAPRPQRPAPAPHEEAKPEHKGR
jgi:hypothetical protein